MNDPNELTTRQRMFAETYLANGFNATEAARSSGYSSKNENSLSVTASRLLKNAKVRAYIDMRLDEYCLTTNKVLAKLSEQALVDMGDFLSWNKDGEIILDLEKGAQLRKLHLIKKLKIFKYGFSIEVVDSQGALIALGKYYKLFSDGPDNSPTKMLLSEEIEQMLDKVFGTDTVDVK